MGDHEVLIQIREQVKMVRKATERFESKLESLKCGAHGERLEELDGRLTPIERVFWKVIMKVVIGFFSCGAIAGAIAWATVGG